MLNIVLLEPEIPWNTGNIGRSCLAFGAQLHLVGRLGFGLNEKEVKRAGLDYWEHVNPTLHADWGSFLETLPANRQVHFFSTKGPKSLWDVHFKQDDYLVFGRESAGLPPEFHEIYKDSMVTIPQKKEGPVRSLNLSTSAGIVLSEATRQIRQRERT